MASSIVRVALKKKKNKTEVNMKGYRTEIVVEEGI